jgi:uncharacterized membrane protein YedE/YeeE
MMIFSLKDFSNSFGFWMLIGFGTRYAGCTSGHTITGLSSLQLPSCVVAFFIGECATWFIGVLF